MSDAAGADGQATAAEGVDWPALWGEFNFDTPDVHGNRYVSRTKLQTALAVSEQSVPGNAESIISQAVESGTLHEVRMKKAHGPGKVLAGYILTEDSGQ